MRLYIPFWFIVVNHIYKQRITLISPKFEDDLTTTRLRLLLQKDGFIINYSNLHSLIKQLERSGIIKKDKKPRHKEKILSLTLNGYDIAEDINHILFHNKTIKIHGKVMKE